MVSTPATFDAVLVSQFASFPNGDFANSVMEGLFGMSLMTLDGEDWYRQREAATKCFTAKTLRVCMLQTRKEIVFGLGTGICWIGQHESHPLEIADEFASSAATRHCRAPSFWWKFDTCVGFDPEKQMKDAIDAMRVAQQYYRPESRGVRAASGRRTW